MLFLKTIGDLIELHFFPLALLEAAGVVALFRYPEYFRANRKLLWLLLAGGIFFFLWRLPVVGMPVASRYYFPTQLILLPFAAVPFTLRWSSIPESKWRRRIAVLLALAALATVAGGVIKRLRVRRLNPVVLESREYIERNRQLWNFEHREPPALFNQSTRGEQILFQAGIDFIRCWVPNFKEEEAWGSGAARIRERFREMPPLPEDLIISYRAAELGELREVLALAERTYGYRTIAEFRSESDPRFWLFLLRKRAAGKSAEVADQ